MNNTTYTKLFRDITQNHVSIGNGDGKNHFARVLINNDVLAQTSLEEFLSELPKMEFPFLVLFSYEISYSEASKNKTKHINGSFIIIDKCDPGDFEAQDMIFDNTESIGEDIIARIKEHYDTNMVDKGYFHTNDVEAEHIGPLCDNFFGTKFYFIAHDYANTQLKYDTAKWSKNL